MSTDQPGASPTPLPAPAVGVEGGPGGVPAPPSIDRGRSAALTAIGQVFVLVGASLIGLVVAATLPPDGRLDAYFAANQLTIAALYVGQTLRTSVPALAAGGVVSIPVLARAAALMTGAVALLLLLALVFGPLLLPEASGGAMRTDLLVLLPGAVMQVGAGYAAGRLAMGGRFAGAALAYALGTLLNAVLLVGLVGSGGAGVLAPTALAGWVTSAGIIGWLLWRMAGSPAGAAAASVGEASGNPADALVDAAPVEALAPDPQSRPAAAQPSPSGCSAPPVGSR